MRKLRWSYVLASITVLAGSALALPGDGETPASRGLRRNDGFDYFSWKTLGVLALFLLVCFIAGAVVKGRKGRQAK